MKKIIRQVLAEAVAEAAACDTFVSPTVLAGIGETASERIIAALESALSGKLVELARQEWEAGAGGNPGVDHHTENEARIRRLAGEWLRQ